MGRKYKDNAQTTLAQAITALSTTLQVAVGKGDNFPSVVGHGAAGSAPDHFILTLEDAAANREKIKVEQRAPASDVLGSVAYPLIRGFDGTAARAWNPGDIADLRWESTEASDVEDKVQAAAPGRIFGLKGANTAGLNFAYYGGALAVDGVITAIADGLVALAGASTNYIERTAAGVVSANQVGFSADKIPLYQIVTDATGISTIADKRTPQTVAFGGIQKSLAAGGTIILTADEARARMIEFTGVMPGNTIVEFPNVKRDWLLRNSTSGGAVTVRVNGQPGTQIGTNETPVYGNGTDIRASVPIVNLNPLESLLYI
jgi:hypothetical protein